MLCVCVKTTIDSKQKRERKLPENMSSIWRDESHLFTSSLQAIETVKHCRWRAPVPIFLQQNTARPSFFLPIYSIERQRFRLPDRFLIVQSRCVCVCRQS